ncbi:MAG: 16S rRNA (cytidine(1402)-2'-O)-methyltransferase [Eubacteriales bacterium]
MTAGILYIVATPIGNLEDMTFRAIKTLETVDIIAAEDTRHTVKLLNHYEIKNKMISYHEHSDVAKREEILALLAQGKNVALVSDAGTPLISDPGADLVADAVKAGISVLPIPGASAAVTALSVSGLFKESFVFEGFLPTSGKPRKTALLRISEETRTLVLYEAPHRIVKTLSALKETLGGDRQMVLAREMTKVYEEYIRGSIDEVLTRFQQKPPKGEMVLILAGKAQSVREVTDEMITEELKRWMAKGKTKKDAVVMTASSLEILKNRVYKISLKL